MSRIKPHSGRSFTGNASINRWRKHEAFSYLSFSDCCTDKLHLSSRPEPVGKYLPRTLDQIIKNHAAKVLDDPDIVMDFPDGSTAVLTRDSFPSRVKVTYTGRSRSIPQERKELIKYWLKTTRSDQGEYVKLFDTEFLFTETLIEYWLPVQSPLIQGLQEELRKGDEVTLYVAWAGARKESGKVDWVFLVNAFE